MDREFFITPQALEKRLGDNSLSIICNFMTMPGDKLDGRAEYDEDRIPGAVYFDLDEISDQSSNLPHMIASPEQFSRQMGELGISERDEIVVYDGPGMFSGARIWWNLRLMGAKNVRILIGGYDRWIGEDRPIEEGPPLKITPTVFTADFDASRVVDANDMLTIIDDNQQMILDARSAARFAGEVEEPRIGLRLGHMQGAVSTPFSELIENGTLIDNNRLEEYFQPILSQEKTITTSCGSGVTAAVLTLALASIGHEETKLFDGSWTQWGDPNEQYPIVKGAK